MVHVDVSEKCDRCKQPYTQKVEDGQVVHSRLRPYDELCKLVDPQLEQAKLAMLEKASSGFVTAQPDVPRYTAVRLPPDKTPAAQGESLPDLHPRLQGKAPGFR
jgi:hypothetical protein